MQKSLGSLTNPNDVLNFVKTNNVDVLFLDIDLKSKISGIDLASNIRKYNKNIYIIFTSAHLEYVLIAYKCKTFDFIPKPIAYERVEDTIVRLIDDVNFGGRGGSFIRIDNKYTICEDSINFIKKDGMKLIFYTDTRNYETYNSFNKISEELSPNFVRCHKSYIANINKISDIEMSSNTIKFGGNKTDYKCFIGPKYKNKLMEVLKNDRNISNNLG